MTTATDTKAIDTVLAALDNNQCRYKHSGGQITAQCPAHDDNTASMTIRNGGGKVLLHCHSGCGTDRILESLNLGWRDLFDVTDDPEPNTKPTVIATYDYHDETGTLIFQKLRKSDKTFLQRRPDGRNGWVYKLGDTRRVLYRLPAVLEAARSGGIVYVVEGEKDANRLIHLGHVATTNSEGAAKDGQTPKWQDTYSDSLAGAHVRLIADNDDAGRAHARAAAASLRGKAASVALLIGRVSTPKSDVSDHLDAGYTLDELVPLSESVTPLPAPAPAGGHDDGEEEMHRGQLRFAERFTRRFAGEYLHAHGIGWHEYDGARWAVCRDGAETRAVLETVKAALAELPHLDGATRSDLSYDIRRVESAAGVNGVLDLAANMHPCTVAAERMDADPHLLNTRSGTVNILTGMVSEPRPSDHMSKVTSARFDPAARSDVFDTFLERIQPDPAMRAFLARQLGSALLGIVREHRLLIWNGTGANGKGTLRDAVRHALGDYAIEVPADILLLSRHGQQGMAPERMRLKGARVAFCSEIDKGAQMDEATMKKLTGGDPINAKLLYRNPIEFDPSHTLVMLTNHLPVVRGDDPATWRRILSVPFNQVIPEQDRDGELPEKLKACPEAILAWLWAGWLDYQQHGLNPPQVVLDATKKYQLDSDILARFLADEDAVCDGHGSVLSGQLYKAFMDWVRAQGEEVQMSNKAFTEAMELRGYKRSQHTKAGRLWHGLMLITPESSDR